MTERVLLYEEALAEVLRHAELLPVPDQVEMVQLSAARGRVLAEPIVADRDQPPFARSTRDGFAIRSADLARGSSLRVLGTVRAGERWAGLALDEGEAIEIMTGAPVPAGADCVLMVEHAAGLAGDMLQPETGRNLAPGENVVAPGAEARAGAELIPPGRGMGTAEIGLAASCGYAELRVYGRPRVAIVATGDELVEVGVAPAAWQIRNSNTHTLASLVEAEGAVAAGLPVARDTRDDLRERLAEARGTDLLLLSGGVSMGKYDLVEDALREAGAEFFFTGARIQPGKPVVFGRLPRARDAGQVPEEWTYFFGLPGNPISTEVCFRLFVAPLLRALCGRTERAPRFAEATLGGDVRGGPRVTRFLPAFVEGNWLGVTVRTIPWQGSGDLAANARANGFVVLPLGVEAFHQGETVRVLLR